MSRVIAQDAASLSAGDNQAVDNLPRSNIRSSIFVWVAGEDDISWRRENNDRINLISDKSEYSPGETAEILIPSPFTGEHEALITIERGRIHQHEVIKMNGSSQVYRLPITAEFAPNFYLSVALVQGREGPQEGAFVVTIYGEVYPQAVNDTIEATLKNYGRPKFMVLIKET